MSASRLLSPGYSHSYVAATGDIFPSSMPPLYANVERLGRFRYRWQVTTGLRVWASGETRTKPGGWRRAHRAAQRPTILRGVA